MSRKNKTRPNAGSRSRLEETGRLRFGNENDCLETFRGWTGQLDPTSLVNAGFMYTGESDAVRCISCNVEIRNWTKCMDPLLTHVERAPHCRHLLRLIPFDMFAEIKDQLFDHKKMRVPFNGAIKWPCNHFTGESVEKLNSFHGQRHHPSFGQNESQPHNPSTLRNEPQPYRSSDVYRYVGLHGDSTSARGELNAVMEVANGDADLDYMLQSVAAQSVLQNGYGSDQVKNAIIDLRRNGKQAFNGNDILEVILGTESQGRQI